MFIIYCSHCEEHREEEFHTSGQAHLARPLDPGACSDKEWGDFFYFRKNPGGILKELWQHTAGCRKYFNVTRKTVSYEIINTYKVGESPTDTESQQHG